MLAAPTQTKRDSPKKAAAAPRPASPLVTPTGERLAFQLATNSAAGDAAEREADAAASAVVGAPPGSGDTTGTPPNSSTAPFGVIVEDDALAGPGQIHRTEFLDSIGPEIERIADQELAATGRTARDCPYLSYWLQFYRGRTVAQLERTIQLYARPERADLPGLREAILTRVRIAVQAWISTGGREVHTPDGAAATTTGRNASPASISGETIQRKGFDGATTSTPAPGDPVAVRSQLKNGQPLESNVRARMERGFGQSFSDVRLHTDNHAGHLASSLSARAFTLGTDIAFSPGQYQPGTFSGDLLLAHELAHVLQQRGGAASRESQADSAESEGPSLESEADRNAGSVIGALWSGDMGESPPGSAKLSRFKTKLRLQRCGSTSSGVWDQNVNTLRIDLYTTTNLNEAPVDPGEAITSDFPSFVARLNFHDQQYPHVSYYRLLDSTRRDLFPPRVPSSTGVSRIPMPPPGAYIVVGNVVTGRPELPTLQLERPIRIIESYRTLAAAQAPTDLGRQSSRNLQQELLGFEQYATVLRQNAVTAAGVPADLIEAWNRANAQAVLIEASINSVSPVLDASARAALTQFYRRLRATVQGSDVRTTRQRRVGRDIEDIEVITNPYLSQSQTDASVAALSLPGPSNWRIQLDTFYQLTGGLTRYVAARLQAAGFAEAASQLSVTGPTAINLRKLYRDHPGAIPVQAVFYPKLQAGLRNDAPAGQTPHFALTALPQKMYVYRTGDGVWHLVDLTRPDRPFETAESGGTATVPPRRLITELNHPERFPEGTLHWQFQGASPDSCEMTHPWTASEVLNLIGAVLAFAGIVALVIGSGGTAAPALIPTICFVASGVVGAAGAAAHMRESSELGTLTTETVIVDSLTIAANLLSAGTAGVGHIVRAAGAAEAAWTGTRAMAALGAQVAFRPLQIAALGVDTISLITFTAQAAEQYAQIQAMPDGESKRFAMQRLVAMSLLTGGMTLFSIRGGIHGLGEGRTLYLDFTTINGVRTPVAHRISPQADILAHARLGSARSDAEAFLARTDLEAGAMDQFRGELSVALTTPGISEQEIQSFVQRIRRAGSPAEVTTILTEFRNNRVQVSVGGVSHRSGYDLTYFHTSPADFQNSVRQALTAEGAIGHNGTLSRAADSEISHYRLDLNTSAGGRVQADVVIVYQDFATGSAIGAGTTTPSAAQGPARNSVTWDSNRSRWNIRVEVDQRLAPRDIGRAVGHELDEAADIVHRLDANRPPTAEALQQRVGELQRPGLLAGAATDTSHDFATLREIDRLLTQRSDPRSAESLSLLLRDIGLTTDARQFQAKLSRMLASGVIAPERIALFEAWSAYDSALSRNSRIRSIPRDEFIRRYEEGWRFDEGGNFRWFKLESERGTQRQFFTEAEMQTHSLAFNRLAGPDSTSSFKPYYDMLVSNGIATEREVRDTLDRLLSGPRGVDLDFVRHELKEAFRPRIISRLTNRTRLAAQHPGRSFEEASHAELLRLTRGLNSSDKGSLAEEWYLAVFAPTAAQHVAVAGSSGVVRFPDLIAPDGTLQDLKYIEGVLSQREREQFDEYRSVVGRVVQISPEGGPPRNVTVNRVRYVFINPRGVSANAQWMHTTLTTSSGGIAFEIFNSSGQRRIVNGIGVFSVDGTHVAGLDFLTDPARLNAWLGL